MTATARVWWVLTTAYVAGIGVLLLSPSAALPIEGVSTLSRLASWLDLPSWAANGRTVEFVLNILIFVPAPYLMSRLRTEMDLLELTIIGISGSVLVEVLQGLALAGRSASLVDLAANSLGVLTGGLVVVATRMGVTSGHPEWLLRLVRGRRSGRPIGEGGSP